MHLVETDTALRTHVRTALKTDFLSIVLKVAERCNLACPYCYFFFGGDDSYMRHPSAIPEPTLERVIAFTRQAKADSGAKVVRVGLHGGEPLLLKKQRFRELCLKFRDALGDESTLTLAVQTNGVLIDPEWIDVFSECKVRVGVSFDGPEPIHNQNRITKRGKGTYAETRRGWQMLVDAANAGVMPFPGLLCVVSAEHSGRAIFEHFVDDLGARGINFLLPDFTHDAPEATPEFVDRCGDFMLEVCQAWFECKTPGVGVRFLEEIVGPLIDDRLAARSGSKHDPLGQMCISSNGEICPDDVMRGYAEHLRTTGQHVDTSTFHDLIGTRAWSELAQAQDTLPETCRACTWQSVCGGGLLQHRYSNQNGFANPSLYCSSLKRTFGYVTSRLIASGYAIADIERRLSATHESSIA
jgi:uncharacterized protein